ncbi:MAG: putative ATP:guanido phosphotransferase [Actinobacteria bacterium ADurb.Bin346]|nr:MAG: putative ATP:guanido phosphotransferase [Actinobacteria bacterium ADurb.Bin346]
MKKDIGKSGLHIGKIRGSISSLAAAGQVILTSRARIARNISGFRFNSINTKEEKRNIMDTVRDSFMRDLKERQYYVFYNIARLKKTQRRYLIEKHMLSPEMLVKMNYKGIIIKCNSSDAENSVSILINEEDHLRIQSVLPGLDILSAYKEVMKIERMLEKKVNFAYEKDFGYLTCCPTDIGTGLRLSIIAHMPGTVVTGRIEELAKNLAKTGYTIRGFFGENSDVVGNLFQVSNQVSLGKNEEDIINEMTAISENIVDEEIKAVESLKESRPIGVEDSVLRSYGMLRYAKMLTYGEALELLSMLKLGLDIRMINNVKQFDFHKLISCIGESSIVMKHGVKTEDNEDEIDMLRAGIIRKKILKGTEL